MSLIGFDAIGRASIGQISNPATTQVGFGWFEALSDPVRIKPGLRASTQPFFAFSPNPIVSFGWFESLSEPVRVKSGLKASQQPFLTFHPAPSPFVATGWFAPLSDPIRQRPRSPAALYPSHFLQPGPSPFVATGWFAPLSEPVRQKVGLAARLQQFLASPSRLLPNPTIVGMMTAEETRDAFLAGAMAWNRVISGEIGVTESNFTGAQIGVVERTLNLGTSGLIEAISVPVSGSAVPAITTGKVSIRIR